MLTKFFATPALKMTTFVAVRQRDADQEHAERIAFLGVDLFGRQPCKVFLVGFPLLRQLLARILRIVPTRKLHGRDLRSAPLHTRPKQQPRRLL